MAQGQLGLTIAIPTYRREQVLLASVQHLLALDPPADEILILDQTVEHEAETEAQLAAWNAEGRIRLLRLAPPSIPKAMNTGLAEAASGIVLFLDDDIIPEANLVAAHLAAHDRASLVAGMVLQPGEAPAPLKPGEAFRFNSTEPASVDEFIGCNFSVDRALAIELGGFDENFVGAAYRFEAEFAHRYTARHGPIHFAPQAKIDHLQAASGGTRAWGHHLRTARPAHTVGAYYYLLRTRRPGWRWSFLTRSLRAVRTRHHLAHPWWIPATLYGELRGMLLAAKLVRKGPAYIAETPRR
jgi:GT2 family glycosyltransferase